MGGRAAPTGNEQLLASKSLVVVIVVVFVVVIVDSHVYVLVFVRLLLK